MYLGFSSGFAFLISCWTVNETTGCPKKLYLIFSLDFGVVHLSMTKMLLLLDSRDTYTLHGTQSFDFCASMNWWQPGISQSQFSGNFYAVQFYGLKSRSFNKLVKRCITFNKMTNRIFANKRHQMFWKYTVWWEKECLRPDQTSAKTNLKPACSWISYGRNSFEFQLLEKPSLENNLLPPIHQAMKQISKSIK